MSDAPVRAVRIALDGNVPAARAGLLVRDDERPFALVGRWAGGGALAGSAPLEVADGGRGEAESAPDDGRGRPGSAPDGGPGGAAQAEADPFALLSDPGPAPADAPAGFVGGGWFGGLGYALAARPQAAVDAAVGQPPVRERLPSYVLARYDHLLRCDEHGQWWFEALWTDARAGALEARLGVLRGRLAAGVDEAQPVKTAPWRAEPSPAGHARAVAAGRERIAAGDLYQANLSLRLRSQLRGDAVDLFTRGAEALGPDRAAFLAGPWGAVASLSPELFLERRAGRVRSAPIKGTRRRPSDPAAAARAKAELAASAKDRAENVMIVDLVRNDLGRVCVPGTVSVGALAHVRPHPGVWHLVSEVEGQLVPGTTDGELLRATFPPGSVTGAPKLAATGVIAELESAARQMFTGAIGFVSPVAGLELSVVIRTFESCGEDVWLDVGGGVVADSDPAEEAAEALVKAQPLLEAIGARLADDAGGADTSVRRGEGAAERTGPAGGTETGAATGTSHGRRFARVPRLGPQPLPRPDPAAGVFETILVRDGAAVALAAHLARLTASLAELYGAQPPAGLAEQVRATASAAEGDCRIRVLAGPDGAVAVETAPLPPAAGPAPRLRPVAVPGGLGPHKWRDRRLLDALSAACAPAVPLLVDLDGFVLEAAYASVLMRDAGGVLVTPPLDGRILPGVTRARTLERARADGHRTEERPIALDELLRAPEVMLASALRGVVTARPGSCIDPHQSR